MLPNEQRARVQRHILGISPQNVRLPTPHIDGRCRKDEPPDELQTDSVATGSQPTLQPRLDDIELFCLSPCRSNARLRDTRFSLNMDK